jgi:outer membrane biosynthesis protein TonB
MIMKKLLSVVLACLIILLVGCSNEKAVKEAATNEFNNETSFPAGNTEAEKPQESEIVESSVQVTEKERENTQSSAPVQKELQVTSSESKSAEQKEKPVEHKEQETKQKSENRKNKVKQETTTKKTVQEKPKEEPVQKPKPTETTKPTKETFDVNEYVAYAKSYAQSIGLSLDSTATECWDNPITANPRQKNIKGDIQSRLNRYKNVEGFTAVWVWAEKVTDTEYEIYIGYC